MGLPHPVVFPEGMEGDESFRRLVTRNLRIEVPDAAKRDALADTLNLPIRALPEWAPNHIVLSADSPLAALGKIDELRENPSLAAADVLLGAQMAKRAMPNDPLVGTQWHLKHTGNPIVAQGTDINVENAWKYDGSAGPIRGSGIVVGVVDDGLQLNHPDLQANVNTALDWNFVSENGDPSPTSADTHGTPCAGNIAAVGNNDLGVSGAAPEAKVTGLRLIVWNFSADDLDEARAMAWESQAIHLKSNSWGPVDDARRKSGPGPMTEAAFRDSAAIGRGGKGSIHMWAGGNGRRVGDNSNYDGYANSIYTIGVGAMDSAMDQSQYSESGANLLVVAPSSGRTSGSNPPLGITTTDLVGASGYNGITNAPDYTNSFGGTSSATPTAAGVVALMLQKNPALGYRDVAEILAQTAKKIHPEDPGWSTNSAGFHFHHSFGAGLVDATAAVTAAGERTAATMLGAYKKQEYSVSGGVIPNNNTTGLVKTFDLGQSDVRIEHVTVTLDIDHSVRGNLEITLTSPSGITSRLAELHGDTGDDYQWTFMTTHNWGERSTGQWSLRIADVSNDGNTTGGSLLSAKLTVHGSQAPSLNPAPLVQITSPANGQVFTPGSTVNVAVSATDLTAEGDPGAITKVELYDGETLVGTDTTDPYTFEITPADGAHSLTAKATDNDEEPAVGTSQAVNITLANSAPVVTAGSIAASANYYDDQGLLLSGVAASDADGDEVSFSYQWQKCSDGRNYTDTAGMDDPVLPAAPGNSGLLWRCKITPGDGEATGAAYYTNAVNVVARPQTLAAPGSAYSYQSGLVLKSNGSPITRDAMINEFSQGPVNAQGVTGQSDWVEILTLRTTSLRNWKLGESSGLRLVFKDVANWDNIPAGTRIVIYNGSVTKDGMLTADDTNAADRTLLLPSTNTTFFAGTPSTWPLLANSGDEITLHNAADEIVARVGYGIAPGAPINVGEVGNKMAAYYTGSSDEGANVASQWLPTVSDVKRERAVPRAIGDLIISEYINGTGNDKAIELYNPSSIPVNLSATATKYTLEIYGPGLNIASYTGALSGTIPAGGTLVIRKQGSQNITGGLAINNAAFTWSGDSPIVLRKNGDVVDCIGQVGFDPGLGWPNATQHTGNRGMRRDPGVVLGDTDHLDPFATPATGPLVGWTFSPKDEYSDLGKHETFTKFFSISHTIAGGGQSVSETAGASAVTGTVTLAVNATAPLTVTLNSSETDALTVPATVTIPAGSKTVTFPIAIIDDLISDGEQKITITASAPDYQNAVTTVTIIDNEPSIIGVTPGKGNNDANTAWIDAIAAGTEDAPSRFRLGTGSTLPTGLSLNPTTGLISGTVDGGMTGSFNVIIERYNTDGNVISQSYFLTIGTGITYSSWISGYPGLSDPDDEADPDGDGLKNVIEFYMGLNPGTSDANVITTERTASTLSITYRRVKNLAGTTATAQWSDDLGTTWSSAGISEQVLEQTATDELVKASLPITAEDGKKFLRLKVEQETAP